MSNNVYPSASVLPYFVAIFEGRAVTIKRDANYETTIKHIQKSIPNLRAAETRSISISTKLPKYGDMLVHISEETWPDLVDQVETAEIMLESYTVATRSSSVVPTIETKPPRTIAPSENRDSIVSVLSQSATGACLYSLTTEHLITAGQVVLLAPASVTVQV
ncbi:hypothetical protein FRC12_009096 [Ceratobasidium sp. 428]|nr:hypothetical protein FRC12_009096 [Ceratobasidium sp. 428]